MRKISTKIVSAVLIASMVLGSNGIVTFASEVEDTTEIAFDVSEIETSETDEVAESEDAEAELPDAEDEAAEEISVEEDSTSEEDTVSEEDAAVVIEDEVIIPEDEPVCEETSSEEAFEEELSEEIPESEDIEEELEIEEELSDEENEEELQDEEIEIEEELLEADGNEWGDDTDIAGSTNLSDAVLWRITADGTLIVKGKGEYPKFENDSSYPAWNNNVKDIVSAEIEVEGITNLSNFFAYCDNMREVDLSKLDTSKVTDFSRMFYDCEALTTIDLSDFSTGNATSFDHTFTYCTHLLTLDLSNFATSKVTKMDGMFSNCEKLTTLTLSPKFSTSSVTTMANMFSSCYSLCSIDLSSFDTGKVESFYYMFSDCYSLASIDVSGFTTENCKNFGGMFRWCSRINELDLSSFDTSSATSFSYVFSGDYNLERIKFPSAGLNLSNVDGLYSIFDSCFSLKEVNLLNFRVNDTVGLYWIFESTYPDKIVLPLNHKNTLDWGISEWDYVNLNGASYSKGLDTSKVENLTYVKRDSAYESAGRRFGTTDDIPEELWVEGIPESTDYTGKAITFEVSVFNGTDKLYEGEDYTISYKNNKNVNNPESSKKKPAVIIKGKRDFTGTYEYTFDIKAVDIASPGVSQYCSDKIIVNSKGVLPNPVLSNGGVALKKGTDYKMTVFDTVTEKAVSKITKAGDYKVRLEGKGNYTGVYEYGITAEEGLVDINKVKIKAYSSVDAYDYCDPVQVIKEISYNGTPLVLHTDFSVDPLNVFEVGNNYVVIRGIGKYTGVKKIAFKGTLRKMSGVTVAELPSSVTSVSDIYSIVEETASLTDKQTGRKLELYSDYLVDVTKYDYAKKKATVCFEGINYYTGKITRTIKMNPVDISEDSDNVKMKISPCEYEKGGFGSFVDLLIYYGTETYDYNYADEGIDYTVSGKIIKAGDGYKVKLTIKGKRRFTGTRTETVNMDRNALSDGYINIDAVKYSKKAGNYKTSFTVCDGYGYPLKSGKEYTNVTYRYVNKTTVINKGEEITRLAGSVADKNDIVPVKTVMKVTVDGINYFKGSVSGLYTVNTGTLASAKVTVKAQTFTGSDIFLKPEDITVKVGKTKLTYGTDYEIDPSGYYINRYKGTAYVKIKGCGDYSGEKIVTFKIKAKLFDKFL